MVFATTENLKCFDCGDIGHKRFACPHKRKNGDCSTPNAPMDGGAPAGPSDNLAEENLPSAQVSAEPAKLDEGAIEHTEVGEQSDIPEINRRPNIKRKAKETSGGGKGCSEAGDTAVQEENVNTVCENVDSVCKPSEEEEEEYMDDDEEDDLSEISEFSQIADDDLYTVDQIISFLDETKGKTIPTEEYFPDLNTFVWSVLKARKTVGFEVLSKQKRFRLKKRLTAIRKKKKKEWSIWKSLENSLCGVSSLLCLFSLFFSSLY